MLLSRFAGVSRKSLHQATARPIAGPRRDSLALLQPAMPTAHVVMEMLGMALGKHQVFNPVVCLVAVDVMHYFSIKQVAADVL